MKANYTDSCFIIIKNKRLEFENSSVAVESFVLKRLNHYKVENVKFLDSIDELEIYVPTLFNSNYQFAVIVDIMAPIVDFEILNSVLEIASNNHFDNYVIRGAVPGTEVKFLLNLNSIKKTFSTVKSKLEINNLSQYVFHATTQIEHNNQLNLYKYKRLKLFLLLINKVQYLYQYSVDEIMNLLNTDEIYNLMIGFGEEVRLLHYENCPHCKSQLQPLYNTSSQPICGYVSSKRPHYRECDKCGLVVPSPFIHDEDIYKVYDKWDKQDFVVSTNNPYTNDSIRCDFSKIVIHLPENCNSLDIGGGVGNFSKYLSSQYPKWDVTHSDFAIKSQISGNFKCRTLDFTNNQIGHQEYNLITAWEVIEHIPFHKFSFVIENIWKALKPGGYFVFSTPDFDSPLCRSLDFYSMGLPFHYTVLGEKWLTNYFKNSNLFEITDTKHCSDFLDDSVNWYAYAEKTSANEAIRGTYTLLKKIFENDSDKSLSKKLTNCGIGTEVIMILKKIN